MELERARNHANGLDHVSDDELMRRLAELVSQSRRVEADLVAHIGEVEVRKLFAREASPSMFAYCTQRLHLSEAEAYLRITVARAARTHGVLLEMLRDGRLHLSGIVRLLPLLTPENRDVLLAQAMHRSKRQILELVAELSPRADVPARIRRLPQHRPAPVRVSLASANLLKPETAATQAVVVSRASLDPGDDASTVLGPGAGGNERGPKPVVASGQSLPQSSGGQLCPDRAPSVETRRAVLEPLSPARYRVEFTASAKLHETLVRLWALLRCKRPDLDLAAVIEQAVSEKWSDSKPDASARQALPAGDWGMNRAPRFRATSRRRCGVPFTRGGRPLQLRRWPGPALHRGAHARVSPSTPIRDGRRPQLGQHRSVVRGAQPASSRKRLRRWCSRAAPSAQGEDRGTRADLRGMTSTLGSGNLRAPGCGPLPVVSPSGVDRGFSVPLANTSR